MVNRDFYRGGYADLRVRNAADSDPSSGRLRCRTPGIKSARRLVRVRLYVGWRDCEAAEEEAPRTDQL